MTDAYPIWVCDCCLFAREGDGCEHSHDPQPWALLPNADVAVGDDRRDFAWSRCDGCGSTLAGARNAYTVLHQGAVPVVSAYRDASAYGLATVADVHAPESHTSAGAVFLRSVRDVAVERWEWEVAETSDASTDGMTGWLEGDVTHEIADGCVPVYTAGLWSTFVDLGAWEDEEVVAGGDLTHAATAALYNVARRLADVVLRDLVAEVAA